MARSLQLLLLGLALYAHAAAASDGPGGRALLQVPLSDGLLEQANVTAAAAPPEPQAAAGMGVPGDTPLAAAAAAAAAAVCHWAGHCLGDPCRTQDDCDNDWVCKAGKCALPGSTPPPPPSNGCPSGWTAAVGTIYDSWPKPGTRECVAYSGCRWAGQFASKDGGSKPPCRAPAKWLNGGAGVFDCRFPETVVKSWSAAATFGGNFALFGKKVQVMVEGHPSRTTTVNVIDKCADSDCGGCCSANTGRGKYTLIDLEKWPASALLGFSTTSPSFDINNVAMPTAAGKRPGAPELSVMPLCYKVLGSSTARSLARSKKGE